MQNVVRVIPTVYFYLLSVVGMVLFIIGLFNSIHYIVGITAYDKYPLRYGAESRCEYMPKPVMVEGQKDIQSDVKARAASDAAREECLKSLEKERANTKIDDLEKAISFTTIGLLVFAIHFYFARRR